MDDDSLRLLRSYGGEGVGLAGIADTQRGQQRAKRLIRVQIGTWFWISAEGNEGNDEGDLVLTSSGRAYLQTLRRR